MGGYETLITDKMVVFFDEHDYGGMSKETFPYKYEVNNRDIYFVRKMDKTKTYPPNVYPYEYTIQKDFPITTKEELYSRPYDICFIGNESPTRRNVVKGLEEAGFKMDVHWTSEKGKISHEEWLNRHRQSKLFLSADGGGFSDERSYQLITIAGFLKNKNNHLQVYPFTDAVSCLEVSEHPTQEELEGLKAVLNDPDYLYEIYTEGVGHMKKYYSEEARCKYILSILKREGVL